MEMNKNNTTIYHNRIGGNPVFGKESLEESLKVAFKPEQPSDCLHDSCIGCKNGNCSGMHMLSCPCGKCSIRC